MTLRPRPKGHDRSRRTDGVRTFIRAVERPAPGRVCWTAKQRTRGRSYGIQIGTSNEARPDAATRGTRRIARRPVTYVQQSSASH